MNLLSRRLTGTIVALVALASLGAAQQTEPRRAKYVVEPYLLAVDCDWASVAPFSDQKLVMVRTSMDPKQSRHSLWESRDLGGSWNKLRDLDLSFDGPGGICLNDLLRLRNGQWLLTGHRGTPELHNGGLPVVTISKDDGATWSPPRLVADLADDDVYYKIDDRTIQLNSGRIVMPAAHAVDRTAYEGATNEALLFISDDNGQTWKKSKPTAVLKDSRGMQEPCVVELRDGRLMILARTGSGSHRRCYSSDGGQTWTAPEPTDLTAACSPLTLKTMPDGRLIVFYSHGQPVAPADLFPRFPLHYAVSTDNGLHWSEPVIVDDKPIEAKNTDAEKARLEFGYPSVCFLPNGILLTYMDEANRRKCCVIECPPK